jgi:hypothetical protein
MDFESSSYYPPRAGRRWISQRLGQSLDRLGLALRRLWWSSPLGQGMRLVTGFQWFLAALIPGRGYALLGQRTLGRVFLAGWWFCAVATLILLCHPTMGWFLGGMASCHSSGMAFLMLRQHEANQGHPAGLAERILLPLVCWAIYYWLVYLPGFDQFRLRVATPLRITTEEQTMAAVFNPRVRVPKVERGDLIAFHQEGFRIQPDDEIAWVFAPGPTFGRVFGLPGDRIVFTPKSVRVNGRDVPRLEGMPMEGEQVVEPGQWFVWPTVRVPRQGPMVAGVRRNPDAPFAEAFHRMSAVRHSDFLGRVYGRWFFRDQTQP